MNSTASIKELVVSKYLCESSTLNFTRYFFKHQYHRKFVIGEHHIKICEALDKVISGEIKKLMINIAPRYGKTELAVKNFMAHGLAINPQSRFIHLSYSDDLALDNSEGVKDIISMDTYRELFNKVKIKPRSNSKKKWYTTDGGGVYATSAAGQVTGFGAGRVDDEENDNDNFDFIEDGKEKFAGALIIDDPIKPEEADSEIIRRRVNERWDSTIKNRVNSRNTPIVIIMQRLHEEDLCGYLLNQSPGEWTVLSFPCLKEDGSALWPFKHTSEELQIIRKENEVVFDRQYQQDPKPLKGRLFTRTGENALKRFFRKDLNESAAEATLGYCDVADQGNDSYSLPVAKIFPKKIFITDAMFTKEGIDVTLPLTASFINKHNIDYVRVEANNQGNILIKMLRDLVSPEKILKVTNTRNKHTRILLEKGFIQEYFYFLDESEYEPGSQYDKFMREIFLYMKAVEMNNGIPDDAVDSISGLAKFIQSFLKHLFTNEKINSEDPQKEITDERL